MNDLYPRLAISGLGGGLLLLVLGLFPGLKQLRKPLTTLTLIAMTCLWALLPRLDRWVVSAWPSVTMMGGQIVFDMVPHIWWSGLLLGLVFIASSLADLSDQGKDLPLNGVLRVIFLHLLWGTLLSGSLMTTLALWAVGDVFWCVAGLLSGEQGERVVLGTALRGVATLILWGVSLYQLPEGTSELWWLMQPRSSMVLLLFIAALVRVGAYPFQIVFPRDQERERTLRMVQLTGSVSGVALLARLLQLPGGVQPPGGLVTWLVFSALWCGVMALASRGRRALYWVSHLAQLLMVAGALASGAADVLLGLMPAWLACLALVMLYIGWERSEVYAAWPSWVAVLYLLGVPPSPLGGVFTQLLSRTGTLSRVAIVLALALAAWSAFRALAERAEIRLLGPWPWERAAGGTAVVMLLAVLAASARPVWTWPPVQLSLALWGVALVLGAGAARWGRGVQTRVQNGSSVVEALDLQWLYRALWQGAEHVLGALRIASGVVEGSGALLWSLLIVLLLLLVVQ